MCHQLIPCLDSTSADQYPDEGEDIYFDFDDYDDRYENYSNLFIMTRPLPEGLVLYWPLDN